MEKPPAPCYSSKIIVLLKKRLKVLTVITVTLVKSQAWIAFWYFISTRSITQASISRAVLDSFYNPTGLQFLRQNVSHNFKKLSFHELLRPELLN